MASSSLEEGAARPEAGAWEGRSELDRRFFVCTPELARRSDAG